MKRLIQASILSNDTKEIIDQWIKAVKTNNYEPFDHFQLSNPQNELSKMLSYQMLDIGTYRMIFNMGKTVLKVAITPIGIDNIDQEISMLENAPSILKKHLAHIYDFGHGWLVMDKLIKELPQTDEYREKVLKMEQDFKDVGINPLDVTYYHDETEPNWENLRLNDQGEIIIIDYGNFE